MSSQAETFTLLFETDRKRLYAYIFAFTSNEQIADDTFQETSMVLWREFSNFKLGTSFSKWANGIAFNRIREQRRLKKKNAYSLSDEMLENLADTMEKNPDIGNKWAALQDCSSALPERSQKLYREFYIENHKAQAIADNCGKSIFAIRKAIHKLRKNLFDCIERKMKGETR